MGKLFNHYRPELHYMRGPGPKWLEKHERRSRPDAVASGAVRPFKLISGIALSLRRQLPRRWQIHHESNGSRSETRITDRVVPVVCSLIRPPSGPFRRMLRPTATPRPLEDCPDRDRQEDQGARGFLCLCPPIADHGF